MLQSIHDIFSINKAALAPLAGVTDSVYRRICVSFGASPVMTEMVSSDGYVRGKKGDKTARLLRFKESERPLGFQFFGASPEIMAAAAEKAQHLKPDFIDINAGCPVKKVVSKGAGSALMRTPYTLECIVAKMADVSHVPVTVKIRSGWDHGSINAVEVARRCADAGAAAVIVHPRTRSQGFSGTSDWTVIRVVREAVAVPVIGSGDIWHAEDAVRMKEETGVDYVMVGRAALGNPWIFRSIASMFAGFPAPPEPGVEERLRLPLSHLEKLAEETSERFAILNMRKFFGWYSKGIRNGSEFRRTIFKAETIEEIHDAVRNFLESYEFEAENVGAGI